MRNIIRFVEYEKVEFFFEDKFVFSPKRKLPWLQKLCFWTLKKLKCNDHELGSRPLRTHSFACDKFIDQLMKHRRNVIEHFHEAPTLMYIGNEEFNQLMDEDVKGRVGFRAEYMYSGKIMTMQVNIIPWMQGLLLI